MATTVGKLNVQVTAGTNGLGRGLNRGSRMIKDFASSGTNALGRMAGGFGLLGAAMGGYNGVKSLAMDTASAVMSGAKAVDDLSDSSKRLFDNKGATGALAGIRNAAEQAGIESGVADKGIAKMLETISKANAGEKGSISALKAIGLDAATLMKMRPEERLLKVADGIGKVSDAGDKITAARGIFGKAGDSLILLANEGSGAIREMQQEAALFGQSLTALDAEKVGAMGDSIDRMKNLFKGVTMQLAVQFAPVVEEISLRLFDMIERSNGVGGAVASAFGQGVDFAAAFLDAVESLEVGWLKLKRTVLNVAASIAEGILKVTDDGGKTADYVAEQELEKRAQYIAPDKREEFKRRAREAGGFQDERINLGRIAEGLRGNGNDTQSEIDEVEKRRAQKGSLGTRFKNFVYEAQTSAAERAQNKLLDNETAITDEMKEQAKLREKAASAAQGTAALTAFAGPVAAFEAATAHMSRGKEGDGESKNQTGLLRQIAQNTRSQSVALG